MEDLKNVKRLIVEVSDDFHYEIKKRCTAKNMTMKEWIYLSISETIRREKLDERNKQTKE